MEGGDLIGVGERGRGKRGGYVLGILKKVWEGGDGEDWMKCIVMGGRGEVGEEIEEEMEGLWYLMGVRRVGV